MIRTYLVLVVFAVAMKSTTADYQCIYCLPGKYKSVVANNACVSCPVNTYLNYSGADDYSDCTACYPNMQSGEGSANITSCRCNVGFYGPPGGPCVQCARATYANNVGQSACSLCPSNADSNMQSDALTDCQCVAGYTGPDGGTCTACAASTYKTTTGAQACTNCVTNTMTIGTASTSENACICTAGYTGGGGLVNCSGCVAGKYKDNTGSAACTNCTVHTYSTAVAATEAATCVGCPANTVSALGSSILTACTCNTGYTSPSGDGYACAACTVGQYKDATGSAVCTDCGYGKYSAAVAAKVSSTCLSCPDVNSYTPTVGKVYVSDCQCNTGYTGNNGEYCAACVAGKYKMVTGDALCTSCVADTYSTQVASITGANCTSCPSYSQSPQSSSAKAACICNMGYTGPGGSAGVVPTLIGYTADMTVACNNLNMGCNMAINELGQRSDGTTTGQITYANAASAGSHDPGTSGWPLNSQYPQFFTIDMWTRRTVVSGLFWAVLPSGVRGSIRIGDTALNRPNILSNPAQYHPSVLGTLCAENLGATEYSYFTCASPIVGRYLYIFTNTPAQWYLSDIVLRGYNTPWYGICTACVAGTFKPTNGSAVCTNCAADMYSTAVAATSNPCLACPLYMQSAAGSDYIAKCRCNAGYTGLDGATCTGCVAGKYKTTVGTNLCTDCLANTFSTAVNKTDSVCETCVFYTTGPSQSLAGSDERTDCRCNQGYTGANGQTCSGCVAGTYKPAAGPQDCTNCVADTYQPSVAQFLESACQNCPADATSLVGSTALASCQCVPGFSGANGGSCTQCYAGQYKMLKGPQACSVCPNATWSSVFGATSNLTCAQCQAYSLSRAGSTIYTDCHCDVGYYTNDMLLPNATCSRCTPGTYNSELGAIACSKCTAGKYSVNYTASSNEVCKTCMIGYSAEGRSQCELCPENAIALPGSAVAQDCKCVPGYSGPDGGTCQYCIAGKFKTENGSALCTECPLDTYSNQIARTFESDCDYCYDNSQSALGSDSFDDCKCSVGYTSSVPGFDGMPCTACSRGLYKNTTGHAACSACPSNTYVDVTTSDSISDCIQCFANSQSAQGSDALDKCLCIGGFERASI